MGTADLDELLRQTLADHRLETAEKQALIDWVHQHADNETMRSIARSRAFAIARGETTLEASFLLDWLEAVMRVFARRVDDSPSHTSEPAGAFFSPGQTCIQEVLHQFSQARKTCDVCVFTITDDRITEAILKAHDRGVALRVITDDEKSHDLGSDIDRLRAAGIACKMDVGNVAHMHHKFALFDGRRLMTGSFNWTRSASEQNEENLIVTADPVLVAAFAARFEQLWSRMKDA